MNQLSVALNTNEARNRNLVAVFQAIREHPGASRKELNRLMPFSLQTMTNVVQQLIDMGLVQEVERPPRAVRGNPHRGLSIVGTRGYILAVQFRWNACVIALVDLSFEVHGQHTVPLEAAPDDVQGYLARLCAVVSETIARHGDKDIWSIALSGPLPIEGPPISPVDMKLGERFPDQRWFSLFASEMTSQQVGDRVARECGLPVRVFNNSQSAALAQAQTMPHNSRFVYILAGLGLGTSFISSGAVSQDVWKHGGEMGHVVYRGRSLNSVISAVGLRLTLGIDAAHGEMEPLLERMAVETPEMFDGWLYEAGPIFRFLVNFVEAALWPDGIAVAGFIPTILIDRLISQAMPLHHSVVPPDGDPRRIMPRLFRARHGAESIPFGAACGVLSTRANADFVTLLAQRRK